jgi:imidazolonepropionase-like amidohydrolase
MITAITNARIFDGERVIDDHIVVIDGAHIHAVGGVVPVGATVVDAHGATLVPGLIDAHVHSDMESLRGMLLFGVTTALKMMGQWTEQEHKELTQRDDIADARFPGWGITPPGGHPTEYWSDRDHEHGDFVFPFVSTPDEATKHIADLVAEGVDYIKIFMEDGTVLGTPRLPTLDNETLLTAVSEAHRYNKITIAHVTTAAATQQVITAGVDGLGHVFIDRPHTPELIAAIVTSGAFVIPTLTVCSSAIGNTGAVLVDDERVSSKLSKKWLDNLNVSANCYPQGNMDYVLATVTALHKAGVDILAGTDVSDIPGGGAPGASLHHELQLLVAAGLTPTEALRAATATPARRFGLTDRGRIVAGARADLLLIDGDPITKITDALSIRDIWRRGVRLTSL